MTTGYSTDRMATAKIAYVTALSLLDSDLRERLTGTTIRSFSPAQLHETDLRVEMADARLGAEGRHHFRTLAEKIGPLFVDAGQVNPVLAEVVLMAAREATLILSQIAYPAACLTSADFTEPRLLVLADCGNSRLDELYNPPWGTLLAGNPQVEILKIPPRVTRAASGKPPSRFASWSFLGLPSIGFRALKEIWSRLPSWIPARGQVLVHKENELLREVAFHLALRGLRVVPLGLSPLGLSTCDTEAALTDSEKAAITETYEPLMADLLRDLVVAEAMPLVLEHLRARIRDIWILQRRGEAAARNLPALTTGARPRMVLTNYPGRPEEEGLARVCRQSGVPVIAVQHGASTEFTAFNGVSTPTCESTVGDLAIAFNDGQRRFYEAQKLRRAQCVSVGMPTAYYIPRHRHVRSVSRCPILFVSTALYRGNVNRISSDLADVGIAQREIRLINELLARLPHPVLFKPYPAKRYLDDDPILLAARAAPNVEIYEEGQDLRYLLGASQVVVTGCATSTISWCLMAERPMFLINYPDRMPVHPDSYEDFSAGLFFFDWKDGEALPAMRQALSRPLAEIRADWEARQAARSLLVNKWFSKYENGAGRRAAAKIRQYLNEQ